MTAGAVQMLSITHTIQVCIARPNVLQILGENIPDAYIGWDAG